jgi:hypothetical protein
MRERDRSRESEEEDRYVPNLGKKAANCPSNRTPVRRTLVYTKHHGILNPVENRTLWIKIIAFAWLVFLACLLPLNSP